MKSSRDKRVAPKCQFIKRCPRQNAYGNNRKNHRDMRRRGVK